MKIYTFNFGAGYHYRSALSKYEELINVLSLFPSFRIIEVTKENTREVWQSISGTYTLSKKDAKIWDDNKAFGVHNSIYANQNKPYWYDTEGSYSYNHAKEIEEACEKSLAFIKNKLGVRE